MRFGRGSVFLGTSLRSLLPSWVGLFAGEFDQVVLAAAGRASSSGLWPARPPRATACIATSVSWLTTAIVTTKSIARSRRVGRPAGGKASVAGWANRRTAITSAVRKTRRGCRPGGSKIRALAGGCVTR